VVLVLLLTAGCDSIAPKGSGPSFEVSFPSSVHSDPITGRIFVFISRTVTPEPRLDSAQTFAVEANEWKPGQTAVIDSNTLGHPFRSVSEIPEGDYYVQAFGHVYVRYPRADGHVIWGLDQWNGQDFTESPGNLYSKVQKVHLDPHSSSKLTFSLTEVVPSKPEPTDTEWVKYIKFESKVLTKFWGRPMYLGAIVLLPKDYGSHPDQKYPVIYNPRNHYMRDGPFSFTTDEVHETDEERVKREGLGFETGYQFYQSWKSDHFPRMITVTIVNYTPFYDLSSDMNSVNDGPYADALMNELIPYLEENFRIIPKPWARVLMGKSSGGRDAFGLQLHYPDFFGGVWVFYPWAFNYKCYFVMNIYEDENAFLVAKREGFGSHWAPLERYQPYTTTGQPVTSVRMSSLDDLVQGGRSGVSAEWTGSDNALNSPIGDDGYPKVLFDKLTGKIDREVAEYWKQHDLAYYAETNWSTLGPKLIGKLHFYIGDMDEWHRNYGVRDFENFLKTAKPYYDGSFQYGPLKGHEWQPMTNAELVKSLAAYVVKKSPAGTPAPWNTR
jgi:hypothetical protein